MARTVDGSNGRSARPAWTRAGTAPAAAGRATIAAGTCAEYRLRLHGQQAFALQLLASELARTADGFRLLAGFLLGGLFVMAAELHLAENPLALHLLFQRLEGLIDVVIANENLHAASSFQVIGLGKTKGLAKKTSPSALSARMYQTKATMST